MRKSSRDTSSESRARSQELRNESSLSERVLWHGLRGDKLGFRFRRQVRVRPYFLDFYCAKAALCVEVDGEQHAERAAKDAARDAFLRSRGIETLRIPSLDLFHENGIETNRWLRRIAEICATRSLSPQPPLQNEPFGEGEPEGAVDASTREGEPDQAATSSLTRAAGCGP